MDGERSQVKLCIRNVAAETAEDDIRDLCSQFGEVKYLKHLADRNLAFVEYASPSQAEAAKSGIYKQNQFGWRVDFALPPRTDKRDSVNNRLEKVFEKRNSYANANENEEVKKPDRFSRFKMFESMRDEANDSSELKKTNEDQKKPEPEVKESPKVEKPTEVHAPKQLETPEKPKPEQKQNIETPPMRQNGALTFDEDGVKISNFCRRSALCKCERCGDYYCSIECQCRDWQTHRYICLAMPRLIPEHRKQSDSRVSLVSIKSSCENLAANVSSSAADSKKSDLSVKKQKLKDIEEKIDAKGSSGENVSPLKKFSAVNEVKYVAAKQMVDEKKAEPPQPVKFIGTMLKVEKIKNNSNVVITYARDHKTLFVRPADPDSSKQYCELIQQVAKVAEEAKTLSGLPERDDVVLAPFEGAYYRALVLQIQSKDAPIKVAFIDFGNMGEVRCDQIKVSDNECLLSPRFAQKIVLKNILVDGAQQEITAHLNQLCEKEKVLIMNIDDDAAELIDPSSKKSINEKINELGGKAPPKKPVTKSEPKGLDTKKLSGKNLRLVVLDTYLLDRGFFVCIDSQDQDLFCKNEQLILDNTDKIQSTPPYTPVPGELCFVLYKDVDDEYWTRAECKEVQSNKAYSMFLIDYMKPVDCDTKRIRKLSAEFQYPVIFGLCFIDGIGDKIKNKAVLEKLNAKIHLGKTIVADTVDYDDEKGYSTCTLKSIVNEL